MKGSRKISNRGKSIVTGRFMSRKMKDFVPWESPLERDFCYILEFRKDVLSFASQPEPVYLTYGGAEHRYTPDFRAEMKGHGPSRFFEVKPAAVATEAKYQLLFDAARLHFKANGSPFEVQTESDIRGPWLDNIKLLYRYAGESPSSELTELCLSRLKGRASTLGDWLNDCSDNAAVKAIHWLLYQEAVDFDLSKPLSIETPIGRNSEGRHS